MSIPALTHKTEHPCFEHPYFDSVKPTRTGSSCDACRECNRGTHRTSQALGRSPARRACTRCSARGAWHWGRSSRTRAALSADSPSLAPHSSPTAQCASPSCTLSSLHVPRMLVATHVALFVCRPHPPTSTIDPCGVVKKYFMGFQTCGLRCAGFPELLPQPVHDINL